MSIAALHETAKAFGESGFLSNFEHVLIAAQAEGCSVVVLSITHYHLLAAAIFSAAGGVLVQTPRDEIKALRERLLCGVASCEDQAFVAGFMPQWHDGRAVTIDGEVVMVTNARHQGTWSGATIVTLDHDSTVVPIR